MIKAVKNPDTRALGELFGNDIFDSVEDARKHIPVFEPGEHTPEDDPYYVMQIDALRLLLLWFNPTTQFNRNLLITGPTGCGKTKLLFVFAARTGRELIRYSVHERTSFDELLGSTAIREDGSSYWMDGPLPTAMKRGAILLLDEVNAARAGALIGLNGVMDGAQAIYVPGSGEMVKAHPGFRIAMTGNSVNRDDSAASFKGTNTLNVAFLDRAFGLEMTYLDEKSEMALLYRYFNAILSNGRVPTKIISAMVGFAADVRQQFIRGECEVTVSTRGLMAWAEMMAMRWPRIERDAQANADGYLIEVQKAADAVLLFTATPPTRQALRKAIEAKFAGVAFPQATDQRKVA